MLFSVDIVVATLVPSLPGRRRRRRPRRDLHLPQPRRERPPPLPVGPSRAADETRRARLLDEARSDIVVARHVDAVVHEEPVRERHRLDVLHGTHAERRRPLVERVGVDRPREAPHHVLGQQVGPGEEALPLRDRDRRVQRQHRTEPPQQPPPPVGTAHPRLGHDRASRRDRVPEAGHGALGGPAPERIELARPRCDPRPPLHVEHGGYHRVAPLPRYLDLVPMVLRERSGHHVGEGPQVVHEVIRQAQRHDHHREELVPVDQPLPEEVVLLVGYPAHLHPPDAAGSGRPQDRSGVMPLPVAYGVATAVGGVHLPETVLEVDRRVLDVGRQLDEGVRRRRRRLRGRRGRRAAAAAAVVVVVDLGVRGERRRPGGGGHRRRRRVDNRRRRLRRYHRGLSDAAGALARIAAVSRSRGDGGRRNEHRASSAAAVAVAIDRRGCGGQQEQERRCDEHRRRRRRRSAE